MRNSLAALVLLLSGCASTELPVASSQCDKGDSLSRLRQRKDTRCRRDAIDYPQAFLDDLAEAKTCMQVIRRLDEGKVEDARWKLLRVAILNTSFISDYDDFGKISKRDVREAQAFARELLDYLNKHRDELCPDMPDLENCLLAISGFLGEESHAEVRLLRDHINNRREPPGHRCFERPKKAEPAQSSGR